jgi:hypothetical protein
VADPKPPKPPLFFQIKGRDGSTPPFALPPEKCVEALNVDFFESSLARKRGGASSISLTGGTAQTGQISALFSHVPSDNQSNREMWSVDDQATPRFKRLVGGTSWADVTVGDAVSSKPWDMDAVSFDGKLFLFYDSTVNRLHCWDPADAKVRRVGLKKPAAATVANTGAGTYAAVIRYYKVRYTVQVSSITVRESELSDVVSFTPSGSGTHARITKPASISEDETHWEVYGSADNSNFFLLATTVVGTTTYDDSATPSTYSGTVAPDINSRVPPPSSKFGVADVSVLVMAGAWETAAGDSMVPKDNRFWWTVSLGSTDTGDSERISNTSDVKNYADVDEPITGLGGTINSAIYIFSYGGLWKAINTGIPESLYVVFRVAGGLGCIRHQTIVLAEDEDGDACIYWLSNVGPVRLGKDGQQRCHEDIDDIWRTVNLSATTVVAHGVPYPSLHQIWWWVATGASNEPDTKIVFDTRLGRVIEVEKSVRRGWAKHDGLSAAARCSCLMSNTLGATMSRDLKPHIGRSTGTAIWKCDTGTDDAGTAFQAYIKSKPYTPWGLGRLGGMVDEAVLIAKSGTDVTIQLTIDRDMGAETLPFTCLLTPVGSETRVFRQFEGSRVAEANSIQFTLGDSAAVSNAWNLDALIVPVADEGAR